MMEEEDPICRVEPSTVHGPGTYPHSHPHPHPHPYLYLYLYPYLYPCPYLDLDHDLSFPLFCCRQAGCSLCKHMGEQR